MEHMAADSLMTVSDHKDGPLKTTYGLMDIGMS